MPRRSHSGLRGFSVVNVPVRVLPVYCLPVNFADVACIILYENPVA